MHKKLGINNRPPIEKEAEVLDLGLGQTLSNIAPTVVHTHMTRRTVGISLNTPSSIGAIKLD